MNKEDSLIKNKNESQASVFDWLIASLMLLGAIIAGITVYLLLFNPQAALASRLPKVSSPSAMDYIFMCSQVVIGLLTAIYVFFYKGKVLKGFIAGLSINATAYLYQILFRSTIERSICEYVIPYSMGPILIIVILINLIKTKNNNIKLKV